MVSNEKRENPMQHEQLNQGSAPQADKEQVVPLPPEAQGQIAKQLRQVYGQILSEPMPDKFAELLARLSKSESNQ